MITDKEKSEFGAGTFQLFCEQFGKDVYAHLLLEILLEGIINAETLFISGQQEQGWDQDNHSSTGRGDSELRSGGFDGTGTPSDLAASHPEDLLRQQDAIPPEN